jgi:hypothetical protein
MQRSLDGLQVQSSSFLMDKASLASDCKAVISPVLNF